MNRVKENKNIKSGKSKKKSGKKMKRGRRYVRFFGLFGLINTESISKSLPFMFFLTFMTIIYIANSYMAEKTIRNIDAMNKELKTLRSEHISGKSEMMFRSKQSEVARIVQPYGIKESVEAPKKIIVSVDPSEIKDNR